MTKTRLFLSLAGALALLAILVGPPLLPPASVAPTMGAEVTGTLPQTLLPATNAPGALKVVTRLSHPLVTPDTREVFLTVDLTGADLPGEERRPVNLAVLIDRSSSMSGDKLERAKEAARHLVQKLREGDALAVVQYGSEVHSLGALKATPDNRARMLSYIERISAEGATDIGAGLARARRDLSRYQPDYEVNRIILISDGEPTQGETEPDRLTAIVRKIRQDRVNVSAIGVGTAFNEDLMQAFAEYGAGSYGYLRDGAHLVELFQRDLQQAGKMVARDVRVRIGLPTGVTLKEVLGYQFERSGAEVTVAMTDVSAGQVERLVAVIGVTPGAVGESFDVAQVRVEYEDLIGGKLASESSAMAAKVTERREEMIGRLDREATVLSTRALTSVNVKRAAESLSKGRRDEAVRYLEQNSAHLDVAAQVAGEAAVADDRTEQQEQLAEMKAASTSDDIQHVTKKAKIQARQKSGRVGSNYYKN